MKRAMTVLLTMALMALPLACGTAEQNVKEITTQAGDTIVLAAFQAADGSFGFSYPADWNAPVADESDANSLSIGNSGGSAQILIKKVADSPITTDEIISAMDLLKAQILEKDNTAIFDDKQSGQVVDMGDRSAVQQVYYVTQGERKIFSVLYYLPIGNDLFLCQLSAVDGDAETDAYLTDLGVVLGSIAVSE